MSQRGSKKGQKSTIFWVQKVTHFWPIFGSKRGHQKSSKVVIGLSQEFAVRKMPFLAIFWAIFGQKVVKKWDPFFHVFFKKNMFFFTFSHTTFWTKHVALRDDLSPKKGCKKGVKNDPFFRHFLGYRVRPPKSLKRVKNTFWVGKSDDFTPVFYLYFTGYP